MSNFWSVILLEFLIIWQQHWDMDTKKLRSEIEHRLSAVDGDFAVVFEDLSGRYSLSMNADEVFHAASTMKVGVLIEAYRRHDEGSLRLDDALPIVNSFHSIVDGSPFQLDSADDGDPEFYRFIGKRVPIRELLERMIVRSSNLATNLLIEHLRPEAIRATAMQLGAKTFNLLRGVEDEKAFHAGRNNTTTARDLQVLLKAIAMKTAASPESCEEMLGILARQEFNEGIPRLLPENVRVAHKTGSINRVEHDAGIVILPDGRRYILVILSKNLASNIEGVTTIADISKIIFDAYTMGK
ncbi:MAG: serine hydrolase [Bacteroidota bacterium]